MIESVHFGEDFEIKFDEEFAVKFDGEFAVTFEHEIAAKYEEEYKLGLPKNRGPDTPSIPVLSAVFDPIRFEFEVTSRAESTGGLREVVTIIAFCSSVLKRSRDY